LPWPARRSPDRAANTACRAAASSWQRSHGRPRASTGRARSALLALRPGRRGEAVECPPLRFRQVSSCAWFTSTREQSSPRAQVGLLFSFHANHPYFRTHSTPPASGESRASGCGWGKTLLIAAVAGFCPPVKMCESPKTRVLSGFSRPQVLHRRCTSACPVVHDRCFEDRARYPIDASASLAKRGQSALSSPVTVPRRACSTRPARWRRTRPFARCG